jgi:hypothetical protein
MSDNEWMNSEMQNLLRENFIVTFQPQNRLLNVQKHTHKSKAHRARCQRMQSDAKGYKYQNRKTRRIFLF